MAVEGSVYLSGKNLEELHELLGGFLDDDEDFNRELEKATTVAENVEGKKFVKFVQKNVYLQEV